MKPFVIVPRVTAETELKYYGYDESNAILTFQTNAFMTTALFELWAQPLSSRPLSVAAKISLVMTERYLSWTVSDSVIPPSS
jgi:hypothetical protein